MKFVSGHTVGIDLGTSYSSIATLDPDGSPLVLENAQGRPITPSIIILESGGKVLVGPSPERVAESPAEHVVVGIKRQMGNPRFLLAQEGRQLTPELLSSMILTKLKNDAERTVGPIGNAVITVPYYFTAPMRQATQRAGRIAGLNVIDILNEPTAATLAYAWLKNELGHPDTLRDEKRVLVYDLGGGTFDVTLVRYTATDFNVIGTDGDTMLGGLDWTERLADHIAEQFEARHGLDPRAEPLAKQKLLLEAEAAKRELSLFPKSTVHCEHRGRSVDVEIDRKTFEDLTADLLQRTQDTTEFVLDHSGVKPSELDVVLLVGGSTSMPMISAMLERALGQKPSRELNPFTAVAQGAAIHAAILEAKETGTSGQIAQAAIKRLKSISTTDVNSHSLGIEVTDRNDPNKKSNHIMIPRNSRLPVRAKQRFVTTADRPRAVHVRLLEGEVVDVDACTFIGEFRLDHLPSNLPAGSPLEITYSYDEQGFIRVSVTELTGKNEAEIEIAWSHGLDEKSIDGMAQLAARYHVQ